MAKTEQIRLEPLREPKKFRAWKQHMRKEVASASAYDPTGAFRWICQLDQVTDASNLNDPGSFAILDAFFAAGITMIDTADVYSAFAGLAGGESLLLTPKPVPSEPTHSLGALALLLLAHQVTDAARFIVFGIAAGMAAPVVAGMAGALGGGVLVAAGWASPKAVTSRTARMARKLVGALLLLTAIVIALHERGIL